MQVQGNIQRIVREIKKEDDVYFSDFKMGSFRGKTIHMTEDEVISGRKGLALKKDDITLEQLLLEKSIIKLDVIAYISTMKMFVDFSINFYFIHEGKTTKPDFDRELSEVFKSDFLKKRDEGDYVMALKRLFKLSELKDVYPIQHQIITFLNETYGALNNKKEYLRTLKNVINLDDFDSWEEYKKEIDELEDFFNKISMKSIKNDLNSIKQTKDKKQILEKLEDIISKLDNIVQPRAKNIIKNMRHLDDFLKD